MDTDVLWANMSAACDGLSDTQDEVSRDVLSRFAGKWPMWVLTVLAENEAPLRFSRILERVEGVTQKVLTQRLRGLERDGLVTRKVYPEVPPRVEYALTPLGGEMLMQVVPLWTWVMNHAEAFETARATYDAG